MPDSTLRASQPLEPAPQRGLVGALERGRTQLRAWVEDGTLLPTAKFSSARGVLVSTLADTKRRREERVLEVARD